MILAYLAHPIGGDVKGNLRRLKAWLRFLSHRYPDRRYLAPVIDWIEVCGEDDGDEAQRAAGIHACCAVARRCDEFWLVGEKVSAGMLEELVAWKQANSYEDGELHEHAESCIRRDWFGKATPVKDRKCEQGALALEMDKGA